MLQKLSRQVHAPECVVSDGLVGFVIEAISWKQLQLPGLRALPAGGVF